MDGTHFIIFTSLSLAGLFVLAAGQNQPPQWDPASLANFPKGFSENTTVGTVLGYAKCIDPEGDTLRYALLSGNAVRVYYNGTVTLAVPLDFEQKDELGYDLTFICVDVNAVGDDIHQPVQYRTEISVDDANDNAPVFETSSSDGYSFRISENASVGTVLTPPIRTRDVDRTVNARLEKLYLICDSRYATAQQLSSLTASSAATCEKFEINYRQLQEGVYVANISLTNPLDYETRPTYSSKLIAVDGPGLVAKFTTTVNVQINVIDAQDVLPVFTNPGASTTISEGAPIGSTALEFAISARDGDQGDRRPIKLEIIEDNLNAFNLTTAVQSADQNGEYSSRLVINNQLDRESIETAYRFVVKATELDKVTLAESTATATATYSVFVSDVNDSPPLFANSTYTIRVTEIEQTNGSVQITGLHITCLDPDEPTNAQYTVRVVEQSVNAYSVSPEVAFFTGSASMFLKVDNTSVLDYDVEEFRTQRVVLEAKETYTPAVFSSSTTISIILVDINDNSPQFGPGPYVTSISESVNSFPYNVLQVNATDKDSGANGNVRYRFETGADSRFSIDPVSGMITLTGAVDFERTPEFVFLVYATDQANRPRSSQVQVTVNVLNANDQGPVFRLKEYRTSANESSLRFLNPINVTAVDTEVGSSQITYRIISGQSPNNAFAINSLTGELTLVQMLDYDDTPLDSNGRKSGRFILVVEASDNGSPPQTSTVSVIVTVIDENNHGPVLNPRIYYANISELAAPGTFVSKINGADDDSGDFGTITYRIGEGLSDNFFVEPFSGNVTVGASSGFDYDIESSYTLLIIATDGGAPQKSATATVYVTIIDGNNKDPVFADNIFFKEVDENTRVNTTVLTVAATDADSTASLVYYINPDNIRATDTNGNQVSLATYNYLDAFGVRNNGDIYVKSPLDKDLAQEITFQLVVRDQNTQSGAGTGTTQITLGITGEPESGITFDAVGQVFMNEDAALNDEIIVVTARDPNNNPVRSYTEINNSEFFDVSSDGAITLAKTVDYENDTADHLHRVVVRAVSPDGLESATVTVTVSIVDVNDNAPKFQQDSYTASVSELDFYPTEVLSVYATDADSKSYGPLEFRIAGGLDSDDFEIFHEPVPLGSVSARRAQVIVAKGKTLDYNRRQSYDLEITVGDNINLAYGSIRLFSRAKLTINVIDENNYSPEFKEASREVAVAETADIGYNITTIIAFDKDYGRNGQIVFTLASDGTSLGNAGLTLFGITPDRGRIYVIGSLLGKGNIKYPLRVIARDSGDIPNTSIMNVTVRVLSTEDDDGNPKWIGPPSGTVLYAPEETPNYVLKGPGGNEIFLDVVARQPNGSITFVLERIDSGYEQSFRIDSRTGVITVLYSLDREVKQSYSFLVYAQDTTDPTLFRTALQLTVMLTDKDDNVPTFMNPRNYAGCEQTERPLTVYVTENTPVNTIVHTLRACDWDQPPYNYIEYNLYTDDVYCLRNNISEVTVLRNGSLITQNKIDYEQIQGFNICVIASSVNEGRKKRAVDLTGLRDDVAFINVVIVDENDNGPKFASPTRIGVLETEPKGGDSIMLLSANDPDGKLNDITLYRIESSVFYPQGSGIPIQATGVFTIRGDKGSLYPTIASYKDFSGGRFILTVIAIDSADNSLQDTQRVTIFVYESGQALKVTLDLVPSEGFGVAQELVRGLDDVSNRYTFTYLQVSEHRTTNGIDITKTDICFLAMDASSNDILNVREVIDILGESRYRAVLSNSQYEYIGRGQCFPTESSEENVKWRDLWWVLVAVAIFLFVCCLILIPLVLVLYRKYKRYMETRKTYLVSQ